MTVDEVKAGTTSTQFVDWQVRMAEDVKREYTRVAKWEHYAAAILADLAEIGHYFRSFYKCYGGSPQPGLFKPEYFMQKFTFRTDEVDRKERTMTDEDKQRHIKASKSCWLGLVGMNTGV